MTYLSTVEQSNRVKLSYAYETQYVFLACCFPNFKEEVHKDFQFSLKMKPSSKKVYKSKNGDIVTIFATSQEFSEVDSETYEKI